MNTINSPTDTNLARGTIIELAQNVYNNAIAAQQQADRAQGLVDGEIARAAAEADRAEAAAERAEAAAGGGGIEAITQPITEFPDGMLSYWNVTLGNENPNSFFIVSASNTASTSSIFAVIPVGIMLSALDIASDVLLINGTGNAYIKLNNDHFAIYGVDFARVTFYRV